MGCSFETVFPCIPLQPNLPQALPAHNTAAHDHARRPAITAPSRLSCRHRHAPKPSVHTHVRREGRLHTVVRSWGLYCALASTCTAAATAGPTDISAVKHGSQGCCVVAGRRIPVSRVMVIMLLCRVGQNHIYIYIYIRWPEPYIYIYGVCTVFLAGKSPSIRCMYTYAYGSGQPYSLCK